MADLYHCNECKIVIGNVEDELDFCPKCGSDDIELRESGNWGNIALGIAAILAALIALILWAITGIPPG